MRCAECVGVPARLSLTHIARGREGGDDDGRRQACGSAGPALGGGLTRHDDAAVLHALGLLGWVLLLLLLVLPASPP